MTSKYPPSFFDKRRSRASKAGKKRELVDVPIFIRKSFFMIETCEPSIAGWSQDGKEFQVIDADALANQIIPQYFKHNNYSSFVRQLNFYGFRKVKADATKMDDNVNGCNSEEGRRQIFHHEYFRRGRPDLLVEIRKANEILPVDMQDVDNLKDEVKSLQNCASHAMEEFDALKKMISNAKSAQQDGLCSSSSNVNASELLQNEMNLMRDEHPFGQPLGEGYRYSPVQPFFPSAERALAPNLNVGDSRIREDPMVTDSVAHGKVLFLDTTATRDDKAQNFSRDDGMGRIESNYEEEISSVLATLPVFMQNKLVDRLVTTIEDPRFLHPQVEETAAISQIDDGCAPGGSSMTIAAATLEAYLTNFASGAKDN